VVDSNPIGSTNFVSSFQSDSFQRREDHWAIVDLIGKAGHVRTIPVPLWVKQTVDDWLAASSVANGRLFRCVCRAGTIWGTEMTEKVVWHVVKQYAGQVGIVNSRRMTCEDRVRASATAPGASWNRFSFCWATSRCRPLRYLGCKQRLREAVNDKIGIEPVLAEKNA
jgi:hypothetical protein